MNFDFDYIFEELLLNRVRNKAHYVCDCNFCGKAKHMYVNVFSGNWDCKKCGQSGNVYKLCSLLNRLDLINFEKTISIFKKIPELNLSTKKDEFEIEDLSLPDMEIEDFVLLKKPNLYLLNRGVDFETQKKLKIGKILTRKFQNYVVIPIFEDCKMKAFVSRITIFDKYRPRYMNSETQFSKIIFNYDKIVKDITKVVIITEGVFDCLSVEKKMNIDDSEIVVVATFGNKISFNQILKILIKKVSKVVLMYDSDAINQIKKHALILSQFFYVEICELVSKKDPDEMTTEEMISAFENLKTISFFKNNRLPILKIK